MTPLHAPARLPPRRPLWLLAGLLWAGGCASSEPYALPPPPASPSGFSLQVAPIQLAYVPTALRPGVRAGERPPAWGALECLACGEKLPASQAAPPPCPACGRLRYRTPFLSPYRPRLDAAGLSQATRALLERRRSFASPRRASKQAWQVKVRVLAASVRLRKTALQPVKIGVFVVSSILIFPALDPLNWFLPGEEYSLKGVLSWEARRLDTPGAEPRRGRLEVVTSKTFAAFPPAPTRPWYLVGFLRVPGCLDEAAWEEISAQLQGDWREDLSRALALELETKLRR